MANVTATSSPAVLTRGRGWFGLGAALFALGLILYMVEFALKHLVVPWYAPILGTAGVLLMIASLRYRRSWLRGVVAALLALLTIGEWSFLLFLSRAPAYTGPAHAGSPLPAFSAVRADGQPFTDADLRHGQSTVLLFFCGRW